MGEPGVPPRLKKETGGEPVSYLSLEATRGGSLPEGWGRWVDPGIGGFCSRRMPFSRDRLAARSPKARIVFADGGNLKGRRHMQKARRRPASLRLLTLLTLVVGLYAAVTVTPAAAGSE